VTTANRILREKKKFFHLSETRKFFIYPKGENNEKLKTSVFQL